MYNGDRDRAEAAFLELSEVADKTRDASNQLQALSFRGAMAVIDGRLEDALDLGQQLIDQAHLLGTPGGAGIVLRGRGRPLIYLEKLGPGDESGGLPAMRPLFLAYMGRHREAAELLERTLPLYTTERGAIDNLAYTSDLESLLEAATVLGNTQVVEQVAPLFADCPGVASPHGVPASTQRLVAAAYAFMGEPERAREHYERAIETCTTMRFRPELALSRLALAELLLDEAISLQPSAVSHPQSKLKADQLRAEGSDHLDFAIKEFEAMKMAPSLERALALRLRVHG